jgi:hypothetical protein
VGTTASRPPAHPVPLAHVLVPDRDGEREETLPRFRNGESELGDLRSCQGHMNLGRGEVQGFSPDGQLLEGRSDKPVMPERIRHPTLPKAVRLIVHGEYLRRASGESLSRRFVRIDDDQADADARPT